MATVDTMEDFIRVMDENPAWLEAARNRLLTRELLEFPARFAEYAYANGARMERFERDMNFLRGRFILKRARREGVIIAEDLGCDLQKTLSARDLALIARRADTAGIPANDLRSFRRADLVMETARMDTGERRYIAVEISYTVNGRDTSRAIRNAGFLRRFTGADAIPAVAGVRKDDRVDEDIAANGVFWYALEEDELETD